MKQGVLDIFRSNRGPKEKRMKNKARQSAVKRWLNTQDFTLKEIDLVHSTVTLRLTKSNKLLKEITPNDVEKKEVK